MDIQKLLDTLSDADRRTRAHYHVTLSGMIADLEKADTTLPVQFQDGAYPGNPHSYRGYYSDLSFEPSSEPINAGEFLMVCRSALGATFEGYKGGDYLMGPETPLWVAPYSCCGAAIVALTILPDRVVLTKKDVD